MASNLKPAESTMKTMNLEALFLENLKDIYYAERKILRALPKMARAAQTPELKAAFEKHKQETEGQVERLQQVGLDQGAINIHDEGHRLTGSNGGRTGQCHASIPISLTANCGAVASVRRVSIRISTECFTNPGLGMMARPWRQ